MAKHIYWLVVLYMLIGNMFYPFLINKIEKAKRLA